MGLRTIAVLSIVALVISASGITGESAPQWKVNEGDKFYFRMQIGVWLREVDIAERTMMEDDVIYLEITSLQEITESSSWVPTLDYTLCRSVMYLQNGSDIPNTGLLVHISSGIWNSAHPGAMPVGDWATASELVLEKNDDLWHNDTYEIVEDSTSWGYTYNYPDLNMTSTGRWSKTDGSLLSIDLVNGISERMYPNESLDVTLERYDSGVTTLIMVIGGVGAVIIIAAVVLFKRRNT